MKRNKSILTLLFFVLIFNCEDFAQTIQFNTAGTHNFTVPSSVITLKVECIGGGGAGGRVTPSNIFDYDAAGGGGGGAYASSVISVYADSIYQVVVGAGGMNNGTSIHGGDSYFGDGSQVLADGGSTCTGNDNSTGANGGQISNSVGTILYNGGNGGNGNEGDANGGGGGGAAGTSGNGYTGGTTNGGASQSNYGGNGGDGGFDGDNGDAGGNYGGGGGGSSAQGSNDRDGGPGASGLVVISWSEVTGFFPDTVCSNSNDTITVLGSNFTGVDSVWVNGTSVSFNVISPTQIQLVLNSGITTGQIVVKTENGKSGSLSNLVVISGVLNVLVNGLELTAQYSGSIGATYQWVDCINGNSPINGATSSTYTATQNGLYAVVVNDFGCEMVSGCETINTVGDEIIDMNQFFIFPNPSSDAFQIGNYQSIIEMIKIVDLSGKTVLESVQVDANSKIDVSTLLDGMYLVYLIDSSSIMIEKLIVKH